MKWSIEIDEINRFVGDVLAQDVEVVAVEQRVGRRRLGHRANPSRGSILRSLDVEPQQVVLG